MVNSYVFSCLRRSEYVCAKAGGFYAPDYAVKVALGDFFPIVRPVPSSESREELFDHTGVLEGHSYSVRHSIVHPLGYSNWAEGIQIETLDIKTTSPILSPDLESLLDTFGFKEKT